MTVRRGVTIGVLAIVLAAFGADQAAAQLPPGTDDQAPVSPRARRGAAAPNFPLQTITPQQIQMMFDSMVLSRVQSALALTDQQFAVFIPKLLKYQQLQQRHRQQRQRLLAELRTALRPRAPQGDEGLLGERAKAIDDLELQTVQDEQKSLADLDTVLSPRQRAQFRVFVDNMEREKINLLVRAQQGRGAVLPGPAPNPPSRNDP